MSHPNLFPRTLASGFTLVEVLVVLTISAILLAVGVPMFNGTIARARASDAANTFLSAVELARSEAARQGVNASACRVLDPAVNPPVCGNAGVGTFVAGDWAAGWAVFADTNVAGTNGVIDANEVVLIQDRFPTGNARRAEVIDTRIGPGAGVITFRPDGILVGGAFNVTVNYPQAPGAMESRRTVNMSVLGQARVTNP